MTEGSVLTTREIVAKLWNLCNVLRNDGVTYMQYVTELTYLLFLKMAKETGAEEDIPGGYRWDDLICKSGIELQEFYKELLTHLGEKTIGRVREIYQGASTTITKPKNLEKIISSIDALDWYSAKNEGIGDLYEGLLEKTANEKKNGAGQYFTPRSLINVIVRLMKPQAEELCNDPACGTFGFMIAAKQYVWEHTNKFLKLKKEVADFEKERAFTGCELVKDVHRLALMNAMLHDIGGEIVYGDTLSSAGKDMKGYDLVLTNPPFGTKTGGVHANRDDFTFSTANKQLNFLQHIYRSLRPNGKARAAVVVPDDVLDQGKVAEKVRKELMEKCNLHTILRLPTGIFYAPGVRTNVLFFTRGETDENNTKEIWIYDLRSEMPSFGRTKPLKEEHFEEFIECYADGNLAARKETYSEENPKGRWRKFSYEDILKREDTSLDIFWIKSENPADKYTLLELFEEIKEKASNITKSVAHLEEMIGKVED